MMLYNLFPKVYRVGQLLYFGLRKFSLGIWSLSQLEHHQHVSQRDIAVRFVLKTQVYLLEHVYGCGRRVFCLCLPDAGRCFFEQGRNA